MTPDRLLSLRRYANAHPEDRAALLVYGDALLELGDERGEAIVQGVNDLDALSPSVRWRVMGRLNGWFRSATLSNGLLRGVSLDSLSRAEFRRLIGLEEWEPVTSIGLGLRRARGNWGRSHAAGDVCELLAAPSCSLVKELRDVGFEAFVSLGRLNRSFDSINLSSVPEWDCDALLPRPYPVRELAVSAVEPVDSFMAWMMTFGRRMLDRLEALHVMIRPEQLCTLLRLPNLQLTEVSGFGFMATRPTPTDQWTLSFRRSTTSEAIAQCLESLRPQVTSIEVEGERLLTPAVREAARSVQIEVAAYAAEAASELWGSDEDAPF